MRLADVNNQALHVSQLFFFFLINLHLVESKPPLALSADKVKPEKMLMFHEALRYQL